MTELSDYRRMVEKPHLEKLARTIQAQHDKIERLTAALSWIEDHDPQIVEAALAKFGCEQGTDLK